MADLNVNSISNAAENGAPDFSHMPTVGGDPVVESGSNSDGEWVRWADGTQHCSTSIEVDWNVTATGTTNPWALPFIATPMSLRAGPAQQTAITGRVDAFVSEHVGGNSTQLWRTHNTARNEVIGASYLGIGRWK